MKIRVGFVSNSSSSSFIISREAYPNVFSLAKHMLEIRNSEHDSWQKSELLKIKKAETKGLNKDIAVSFSTCNYDTYIIPKPQHYLVSTCNNHVWSPLRGVINTGGGHDNDDYVEEESKTLFWFIREGVLATPLSYNDITNLVKTGKLADMWCNIDNHFAHYCKLELGIVVCPSCWKIENPRKDMFLDKKVVKIKPIQLPRSLKLR